jgi:hypothetical protein
MESETSASPEATAWWRRPRIWIIGAVLLALVASVTLIEALGGGWTVADL